MAILPSISGPNSKPQIQYTFSFVSALRYALPTSPARTFNPCAFTMMFSKHVLSNHTTELKLVCSSAFTLCPPTTNLAFRLRSDLTLNAILRGAHWYPLGTSLPGGRNSNVCYSWMLSISRCIASFHN